MLWSFFNISGKFFTKSSLQTQDELHLNAIANEVIKELFDSVNIFNYRLGGANGIFAASKSVEHDEFKAYVNSRILPVEFPGALGFGFIEYVKRENLADFLAKTTEPNGIIKVLNRVSKS